MGHLPKSGTGEHRICPLFSVLCACLLCVVLMRVTALIRHGFCMQRYNTHQSKKSASRAPRTPQEKDRYSVIRAPSQPPSRRLFDDYYIPRRSALHAPQRSTTEVALRSPQAGEFRNGRKLHQSKISTQQSRKSASRAHRTPQDKERYSVSREHSPPRSRRIYQPWRCHLAHPEQVNLGDVDNQRRGRRNSPQIQKSTSESPRIFVYVVLTVDPADGPKLRFILNSVVGAWFCSRLYNVTTCRRALAGQVLESACSCTVCIVQHPSGGGT
jgi:hypothetical protein